MMVTPVQPWFMGRSPDLVGTASRQASLNVLREADGVLGQPTEETIKSLIFMEEKT